MTTEHGSVELSGFLRYLAKQGEDGTHLPSLVSLSQELGISIATLREQLEVARALGLVDVKPRTGIRRLPYSFTPAVLASLAYASAIDPVRHFHAFSDLRKHIEAAYWYQAVSLLTPADHTHLHELIDRAEVLMSGQPIQIPHAEHRELHLAIYRRLDNPFVTGILEAYWEVYEAVGLNLYADIDYLKTVWAYHRRMVESICDGNFEVGYQALNEHTDLLLHRANPNHSYPSNHSNYSRHEFE